MTGLAESRHGPRQPFADGAAGSREVSATADREVRASYRRNRRRRGR